MMKSLPRFSVLLHLALSLAIGWLMPCTATAEIPSCEVVQPATAAPPPVDLAEVSTTKKIEVGGELDAYYSNINFYLPLTADKVPNLCNQTELEIYRYLLARSLVPRFVYLELSVNPLPLLGVYLRSNHRHAYEQGAIGNDFNLVESVTAGFREPYAFSVFFGSLVDFVKPGATKIERKNRAYSGYLMTAGDHHILHNRLVNDRWLELEWKLKGDRDLPHEKISWSFRVGGRLHDNPEIADAIYFGLRRSNLDYQETDISWRKNSSITLMSEFSAETLKFQRQEVIVGKKYPLKSSSLAFSLDLGGIWQVEERIYSGSLSRGSDPQNNFIFVIRPNIIF